MIAMGDGSGCLRVNGRRHKLLAVVDEKETGTGVGEVAPNDAYSREPPRRSCAAGEIEILRRLDGGALARNWRPRGPDR